jgi:hypothetical protein
MERIPGNDRYLDPPDEPENPRCLQCDEQMELVSTWTFGLGDVYECHTPTCPECAKAYRDNPEDTE